MKSDFEIQTPANIKDLNLDKALYRNIKL